LCGEGKVTPLQAQLCAATMPEEELYDVAADPHETKNLAGSTRHRAVLARLRTELDRWIEATNDQGRQLEPPAVAAASGRTRTTSKDAPQAKP
jgi:uncharacterized sulfatase